MRLVIDLQAVQSLSGLRGIGRYANSLVRSLCAQNFEHEVVLCLNDAFPETVVTIREEFCELVGRKNIRVWSAPGPTAAADPDNSRRRLHAEIIYEAFLLSQAPDVILICSLFEGHADNVITSLKKLSDHVPVAVISYDLIPLHDPQRFLKPTPTWDRLYREKLQQLKQADLLLAISQFTAADLEQRLRIAHDKIKVISAGCSDIFKPSQLGPDSRLALKNQFGIYKPYIITSGTIEPHKNLVTLFRAFALLPEAIRQSHMLVLIGDFDEGRRVVIRHLLSLAGMNPESLIMTGYVSDEHLVALYSDAELMVFPSTDEGFGLPILESMACGTPSLGSRSSSIPEVVGFDSALFDPRDPKQLCQLIIRALEDEQFRTQLSEHGLQRAKLFNWDKVAKSCLSSLEALVRSHGRVASYEQTVDSCISALSQTEISNEEEVDLARSLAYNFPDRNRRRKLFVDISQVYQHDVRTGIQRVTRSVLLSWLRRPPNGCDIVPVYATDREPGFFYVDKSPESWSGIDIPVDVGPIDYSPGDIFFGLDLGLDILPLQREYLRTLKRRGVVVMFAVYDLLPMQLPHCFTPDLQRLFEPWLEIISESSGIVGISKATVDAFVDWQKDRGLLPQGAFAYEYVHLGADIENSLPTVGLPENANSVIDCIKSRLSFLMVGTLEPRKGHSQVIDAFDELWERGHDVNLVIVGKNGWKVDELASLIRQHKEFGKRLFWLEAISDEYLRHVYDACKCLIAASEGEGFGLPLIEAAQHGIPVLARDIPVFREVGKNHVSYFDTTDPFLLALSIEEWIREFSDGNLPSIGELEWLTWDACATQIADILTCH